MQKMPSVCLRNFYNSLIILVSAESTLFVHLQILPNLQKIIESLLNHFADSKKCKITNNNGFSEMI